MRHTDRHADRQTDRQKHREKKRERQRPPDRQTGSQVGRQKEAGRQIDRQVGKEEQTDGQTDRQASIGIDHQNLFEAGTVEKLRLLQGDQFVKKRCWLLRQFTATSRFYIARLFVCLLDGWKTVTSRQSKTCDQLLVGLLSWLTDQLTSYVTT